MGLVFACSSEWLFRYQIGEFFPSLPIFAKKYVGQTVQNQALPHLDLLLGGGKWDLLLPGWPQNGKGVVKGRRCPKPVEF